MRGNAPRPGTSDIEISSGDFLNLENPEPDVITIDVIAHHLAQQCRYTGAPRRNVSVGEHTLLVSAYLEFHGCTPPVILAGLNHDDPEAFIGDMTRPLKEVVGEAYSVVEERLEIVIAEALKFEELGVDIHDPLIKQADNWALAAEAYYTMPTRGRYWWCWGLYDPTSPEAGLREVLQLADNEPNNIKSMWKWRHLSLVSQIKNEQMEVVK